MNIGTLRHLVTLENPAPAVPDGDGGYTEVWAALMPSAVWASIESATQRALERVVANVVLAQATHIVKMRYHSGVTIKTRLTWTDKSGLVHRASVTDRQNVGEQSIELVLVCAEIVT